MTCQRTTATRRRGAPAPAAAENPRGAAMPPALGSRPRPGFTLIEALVVVAIIAVLSALLAPGLQRALGRARGIACLNLLKNMAAAAQMYAGDWAGALVPTDNGAHHWYHHDVLGRYLGLPAGDERSPAYACPQEPRQDGWETFPHFYGVNGFVSRPATARGAFPRLSAFKSPGRLLHVADMAPAWGNGDCGWHWDGPAAWRDRCGFGQPEDLLPPYADDVARAEYAPYFRHHGGGGCNFSYMDGHVASVFFGQPRIYNIVNR